MFDGNARQGWIALQHDSGRVARNGYAGAAITVMWSISN
jgi:hypothetical protein